MCRMLQGNATGECYRKMENRREKKGKWRDNVSVAWEQLFVNHHGSPLWTHNSQQLILPAGVRVSRLLFRKETDALCVSFYPRVAFRMCVFH